ncbi:MAG: extracellular solute-binding protein family 5 [Frankiales bacterium]|nr:extracellular solute-binding protein family 5 [Frankiales bacterium]
MARRSIRRAVVATAAGLAAALALAACGGGSSGSTNASGGGGGSGNAAPTDHVLHLSFLQDPGQPPDPDVFYAGQGLLLTTNLYEGLLTYKTGTATPTLEPALATSWTESADHKTFTFQLRKGVTFHDGTPFTSAAIKASFDRRLAVNQGPAYMVTDIASITTQGDYAATIKLKHANSSFLAYMAAAYGPKMMSPTALAANKGKDNDQTYLTTHDIGTGAYTLTQAEVGAKYEMKAYDKYWGGVPYFTTVEMPVITDSSAQQLQFNNGQLAAIIHDLPSSAVSSYLTNKKYSSYTLPTMMSDYLYVNPHLPLEANKDTRLAILKAIDVDAIVKQAYFGRGVKADQVYPANMMAAQYAQQNITYDPSVLKAMVGSLSTKSLIIGYDSSSTDNQLVANLIAAELSSAGLTAKVQSYPTSETFGWVGNQKGAPDLFATTGWPDAPPPYTWAHISFDADGGLNYLGCSDPATTALIAKGLATGSDQTFSDAAQSASASGCWLNLANISDFVVGQTWLKGVADAHTVSNPNSLIVSKLSAG